MTNEGEKGERRFLDLDKISGEGKTLKEIIESGEEIPDEVKETMQAFAKAVEPVVERSRAQLAQLATTIGTFRGPEFPKLGAAFAERITKPLQEALDSYYADLAESLAAISAGRLTRADVGTVIGPQYKALELQSEMIGVLQEMLRAQIEAEKARKRRERKEDWRFWLMLLVTIVVGGWVGQWLLDAIQRLLGG